ncbi:aldehyde dehydrogenase [Parastagonospora nodorum]|nr:aldehyde dehydrogenase [Parastagonospora nodorum]KAH5186594.1 aldehyde dehydrogenase [Parastagonospora nodorum]KAH5234388.1 aldehyde dehydrogenase [Parastagonospora nodorum]KAH5440542.1 aldehyde dehydrogenase [Parastagonospora nodorum]KAH5585304.1 aldehyde dehydrogenase [Parastagonospora nodorum]
MPELPPFEHTPMDDIATTCATVRTTFLSHKTRPVEFRIQQLRKLYWAFKDNKALITEACKRDLGKSTFETYLVEISWCMNDCIWMANNLPRFAKDEKPSDISFTNRFVGPRIRKDPLGTALIIGAYNFPIQLTVGPLIGAIAAGCTAIIKPSESAPNAAAILQKIIGEALDPSCYRVVQGAIPETTALLDQKWDTIFYTGSEVVARIIAKKAAETLTPLVLELGGRNPAIITKHADPKLAAKRLLWAKTLNAGQVCVSQNCTFIDREIVPAFIREMKNALAEFYPEGARKSPDYGRIVNQKQFQRLKKMLDESHGNIVVGGTMDEDDLFIEPTVVQVNDINDSMVRDESFGPLLPIIAVTDLDEAIKMANEIHDTPLGTYAFGNKKEMERILNETRSGGASLNDGFFHASIPTLAFGGVGTSGQGAYRGKASFDVFTHRRSVTTTPAWLEGLMDVRYPPYTAKKLKKFAGMNELKPNFDREGRPLGWGSWFLGLLGLKGLAVLLAAIGIRQYLQRRAKL